MKHVFVLALISQTAIASVDLPVRCDFGLRQYGATALEEKIDQAVRIDVKEMPGLSTITETSHFRLNGQVFNGDLTIGLCDTRLRSQRMACKQIDYMAAPIAANGVVDILFKYSNHEVHAWVRCTNF